MAAQSDKRDTDNASGRGDRSIEVPPLTKNAARPLFSEAGL
jgi:hypothetical protein